MAKLPLRHIGRVYAVMLGLGLAWSQPLSAADAPGTAGTEDPRPLSAAQIALFETPHLQNIGQPETLEYRFSRQGPDGFDDRVALHIRAVHPDGTRDLSFGFLTGAHRVAYPELDAFRGNPLLMLLLDRDVQQMKETLGLSAAYFRNHIRESFVDHASVQETTVLLGGKPVPARRVVVTPFAEDGRLEHLPTVQAKSYSFVLADAVPGMVAEIRIAMPANAAQQLPAYAEQMDFDRAAPPRAEDGAADPASAQ